MKLKVGCVLGYEVAEPHTAFAFNILATINPQQTLREETIVCTPAVPYEVVAGGQGGRVLRCEAAPGGLTIRYEAKVEISRPAAPAVTASDQPSRLPLEILTHTLPSRYCESDRFGAIAWELFGDAGERPAQVGAICEWIDRKLSYVPGSTDTRTSAWDVWLSRRGVCRDYTHLALAFCRALNIPARYVSAYAVGLEPMDFHACFEAYLGGEWRLFDPTDQISPERIAVISRGRDAASAALTTIYGRVKPAPIQVTCEVVDA